MTAMPTPNMYKQNTHKARKQYIRTTIYTLGQNLRV